MGRGKVKMELIANKSDLNRCYKKRMEGLKKKIREFSTLCGVDACMIIYGPNQGNNKTITTSIKPEIWPQDLNDIHGIIKRYRNIPKEERDKRTCNCSDFLDNGKKDKTHEYDDELLKLIDEPEYVKWNDQVKEFSIDQLKQLHSTLGSKINALGEKIQSMVGEAGMSHEAAAQNGKPCYDPMSMSSFNSENFCIGGTSNEAMEYPCVSEDQMMMTMPPTGCHEMEIESHQGTSTDLLQPSILQQSTGSYLPSLMPAPSYG